MRWSLPLWIFPFLLLLVSCTSTSDRDASALPSPSAGTVLLASFPLTTQARPTTAESLFLANLNANIEELEKRVSSSEAASAALASALLLRFRIVGRLEDGERALTLAQSSGNSGLALLTRAAAQMTFHDFAGAAEAIAALRSYPEHAGQVAVLERDLNMALGNYSALADDFRLADQPASDFFEMTHRADIRLMQGNLDGATAWYRAAQDLYGDVSPFPLAWLYTQQGIAILRHGDFAAARPFFAAAVERLPSYYLAAEHLAECEMELGELDRARARYQAVIAQTGNPEFYAALADLETRAGNAEAAAQALKSALAGYEQLLARYPSAYAHHAAEFLIEQGQTVRALALARENLALRKDIGSWILLATAAEAAGDQPLACEATTAAVATGLKPPELAELDALRKVCAAG
jgi:tetratricopeptide (TPR) repeat protein